VDGTAPTPPLFFGGAHIEDDAVLALERWLRLWQLADEAGPMMVALTITNVRGYHMPLERSFVGRSFGIAMDRDVLMLPDTVVEDLGKPTDVILKPIMDIMWQAGRLTSLRPGWPTDAGEVAESRRHGEGREAHEEESRLTASP